MNYLIEPIGTEFSDRDVKKLADLMTGRAREGYLFHSVFQVTQPGCLGFGRGSITYLAVYVKR